jgi:hypothetical protein
MRRDGRPISQRRRSWTTARPARPGGFKEKIEVEQTVYQKPKRCAGKFIRGPLKGTWAYTYTEKKDGTTHVLYEMDYELSGLLRFAGGLLNSQYADGISKTMAALKKYVESGKGPKALGPGARRAH